MAAGQLGKAKRLGVATVVDGTPINLGRDIHLIRETARRTGLNFIASTGFYYQEEPWLGMRDEEQIYDLLMSDCLEGISGTDSRAGILKAGVAGAGHSPASQNSPRHRTCGRKDQGCPFSVITIPLSKMAERSWIFLANAASPASKIILGHSGDTTDLDYLTRHAGKRLLSLAWTALASAIWIWVLNPV